VKSLLLPSLLQVSKRRKRKLTGLAFLLAGVLGLGLLLFAGYWWRVRVPEQRYEKLIRAAANRHGVDPALVRAVVWQESRFNARARGRSGEIGLMQIMEPAAHEWARAEGIRSFRHEQLFDPEQNLLAGTWYLQRQLQRFSQTDNPIPYALASYNAGGSNAARWRSGIATTNSEAFIESITFPGTKKYVQSVMARHEHYRSERSLGSRW
jgi:soluble lytic murein transglycosylase